MKTTVEPDLIGGGSGDQIGKRVMKVSFLSVAGWVRELILMKVDQARKSLNRRIDKSNEFRQVQHVTCEDDIPALAIRCTLLNLVGERDRGVSHPPLPFTRG